MPQCHSTGTQDVTAQQADIDKLLTFLLNFQVLKKTDSWQIRTSDEFSLCRPCRVTAEHTDIS